ARRDQAQAEGPGDRRRGTGTAGGREGRRPHGGAAAEHRGRWSTTCRREWRVTGAQGDEEDRQEVVQAHRDQEGGEETQGELRRDGTGTREARQEEGWSG